MNVRHPRTRRWRIPPVPFVSPERLVGAALLRETGGEPGMLLWRSLRTVHAWAATPPADRAHLFSPDARDQRMADLLAAAPEPALEQHLRVLAELLARPARMDADRVALACLGIAAWARDAGKPAACAEFTHVAAAACPGSPAYALAAARESRDTGCAEESEMMYGRVVALARQVGDWDSYTRAHAGLGKLAQARGAYPAARKYLHRALRAAERHRLAHLRALVLHELFTVEVDCDCTDVAERYAAAAFSAYAPGTSMIQVLAFDVAVFWMERGWFAQALSVFRRIVSSLDADGQVVGWGDIARAAGGAGDADTFELAWAQVTAAPLHSPRKQDGLRDAARGAISLGRLDMAEEAAREALSLARQRADHKTMFVAEAMLEEIGLLGKGRAGPERCPEPASESSRILSDSLFRALDAVPVS